MLYFMHLDTDTMYLKVLLRLNVSSIVPNPLSVRLEIKKIVSVSIAAPFLLPSDLRGCKVAQVLFELDNNQNIFSYIKLGPEPRLLANLTKISSKYCFYN